MRKNKAQSIIEYVVLFLVVATAITVTYRYMYRSMNARLEQVRQEISPSRQ